MIYISLKKNLSKIIVIYLFLFVFNECKNNNVIDTFDRSAQIFVILENHNIPVTQTNGFIFILKSFGCSPCEELTYGFINQLLDKYDIQSDKDIFVISTNDEILLLEKLFNDTCDAITYFILSNYEMSKYGLIFNTDLLIEINKGKVVNFVPITTENYKKLIKMYIDKK